jgi:hypothetical protein
MRYESKFLKIHIFLYFGYLLRTIYQNLVIFPGIVFGNSGQLKIPKNHFMFSIFNFTSFHKKKGLEICIFPLLLCNQSNHHPQEDLAKFGYSPYTTKKNVRIHWCFGCLLEPDVKIWRFIYLVIKVWRVGAIFIFIFTKFLGKCEWKSYDF